MVISIILLLSLIIIYILKVALNIKRTIVISLAFFYHLLFIVLYYYYFLESGSDASDFYFPLASSNEDIDFQIGGLFIVYIAQFFIKLVNMTFFDISLLFGVFGFFGILINYITILENIKLITKSTSLLTYFYLFIPGINFWTSSLGKDSFIFFFISLIFFSISSFSKRKPLFYLSIVMVFFIRPQIAIIIIIAMLVSILHESSLNVTKKYFFILTILISVFSIMPYVMDYIGLSELSINTLQNYISTRQGYNQNGSSSFDLKNTGFLVRNFTYLFRPLFFDANSLFHLILSFENIVYLYIFTHLLNLKYFRYLGSSTLIEKFSISYIFLMTITLSSITANLGIAVRQKTMFITCLVFLFVIYMYRRKTKIK